MLSYATALAILALTLGLVIYLRNSHFGMALKAIREDPISASMAGINVVRERIIAWLLSALNCRSRRRRLRLERLGVLSGDRLQRRVHDLCDRVRFVRRQCHGNRADSRRRYSLRHLQRRRHLDAAILQLLYGLLIMGLVLFLPNGLVSLLQRWASMSPDASPLLTVDGLVKRFAAFARSTS